MQLDVLLGCAVLTKLMGQPFLMCWAGSLCVDIAKGSTMYHTAVHYWMVWPGLGH